MGVKTDEWTVYFGDVELAVVGNFCEGTAGTWIDPPEPDQVEIESVLYKDVDVTDLICEIDGNFLDKIERQIIEKR